MQRVSQSYKADAQDAQPLVAERQPGLWDSMSTMLADHIHHVDERRIWNLIGAAAFPVPCPLSSWKATAHPSLTLARWPQKRRPTKDFIGVTVTRNSERKTARDHRDPCVVLLANSLNPVETFPWFVYGMFHDVSNGSVIQSGHLSLRRTRASCDSSSCPSIVHSLRVWQIYLTTS